MNKTFVLEELYIEVDDEGARAYLDDKQSTHIGEITIHLDEHWPRSACIHQMLVDEAYQRKGIGMRLLRALYEEYGKLGPPPLEGRNATSEEGMKLINKAVSEGLVFHWHSPGYDSEDT